ncbi:MAG: hypothetical protein ACK5QU_08220 [Bacteroidota bacterium]|jgi:hypothetical protein
MKSLNLPLVFKIAKYKDKIAETLSYSADIQYEPGELLMTKDQLFSALIGSGLNKYNLFDTALSQLCRDQFIIKTDGNPSNYRTTQSINEFHTLHKTFIWKSIKVTVWEIFKFIVWLLPLIISIHTALNNSKLSNGTKQLQLELDSLKNLKNTQLQTDTFLRKSYTP